ncbi:uncharacterized protein EMH_0067830 [Eimeria mitis]|uniref:Uncharacterized protein n=1 Tax=Eimeria mitis TaxID=44415 RepID=U6K7U3_9EIME|nr:uncharacterized protein EMH_0067830 [Eimeria mitis]CDJ31558.1 hypothetical protein EMH_0067830 [Eimeria mitis]
MQSLKGRPAPRRSGENLLLTRSSAERVQLANGPRKGLMTASRVLLYPPASLLPPVGLRSCRRYCRDMLHPQHPLRERPQPPLLPREAAGLQTKQHAEGHRFRSSSSRNKNDNSKNNNNNNNDDENNSNNKNENNNNNRNNGNKDNNNNKDNNSSNSRSSSRNNSNSNSNNNSNSNKNSSSSSRNAEHPSAPVPYLLPLLMEEYAVFSVKLEAEEPAAPSAAARGPTARRPSSRPSAHSRAHQQEGTPRRPPDTGDQQRVYNLFHGGVGVPPPASSAAQETPQAPGSPQDPDERKDADEDTEKAS